MNIFFLHKNHKKCAIMHVNKHVVKMILESCQLLCSAHHICKYGEYIPPYKLTHKNHPCSIWVRTSKSNYLWLVKLFEELCKEYTYRYKKIHKCQNYLNELTNNIPNIPDIGFTTPPQCMPDMYKNSIKDLDNVIDAYRQYYFFDKNHILDWKERDIPKFVLKYKSMFE